MIVLRPGDALDMVRQCRALGVQVVGMDGFRWTPTTIQPVMEESPDYDNLSHTESWDEAEKFLSARLDSELYYDVIVSSIAEIYVSVLDKEGMRVWRPVKAEHLHDNVYRIVTRPHDRTTESCPFKPGDTVLCETVESENGAILAATRKANA